jgi:hypothetical protein
MQAGIISQEDGRRLLNFPDLEADEKLKNAQKDRILKQLDGIIENGKYDPPDPFTSIQQGLELVTQYYNLYVAAGLEESKAELLRNYHSQVLMLQQASMPPAPPMQPGAPIAQPLAPPTSSLMPINQ